jgi:hypothetical protein
MTSNITHQSPSIYPEDYPGNEWYDDYTAYRTSRRFNPDFEELDESSSMFAST